MRYAFLPKFIHLIEQRLKSPDRQYDSGRGIVLEDHKVVPLTLAQLFKDGATFP